MRSKLYALSLLASLVLAACAPAATPTPAATSVPEATATSASAEATATTAPVEEPTATAEAVTGDLVIYSGRAEALILPIVDAFKAKYPEINVSLKAGSNSELANALLEEQANPQADAFVTTELVTIQKLADEGVLQAYVSPNAAAVPEAYKHPEGLWTGLTLRARVIIYNTDLVTPEEAPQSIFDLTDPKWQGQIAAAGSTNGGMQAQVGALRQLLGDEETQAWLNGLTANGVTFFGGHTDVRKAVGAGEFKIGLVNHYYYHLQLAEPENNKVAVVYPDQGDEQIGLIVNATSVGLINGAKHSAAAQLFVDFLLSAEGQQLFAELNYEYPMVAGVALKEGVQPLDQFRLATFDVVEAAASLDTSLDMLEIAGIP